MVVPLTQTWRWRPAVTRVDSIAPDLDEVTSSVAVKGLGNDLSAFSAIIRHQRLSESNKSQSTYDRTLKAQQCLESTSQGTACLNP